MAVFFVPAFGAGGYPHLAGIHGILPNPLHQGTKMLILTGRGGEGKSRIGLVLRALLGSNMNTGSIANFARRIWSISW